MRCFHRRLSPGDAVPVRHQNGPPTLPTSPRWRSGKTGAPRAVTSRLRSDPTVQEIVKKNDAQVIFRSTSFLDDRFPGDNSKRAAAAYGCAVDAGEGETYHNVVYANQPATEGDGHTEQQLLDFAPRPGSPARPGDVRPVCQGQEVAVGRQRHADHAGTGIPGTPSVVLNGQQMTKEQLATPEAFKKAVLEASAANQ